MAVYKDGKRISDSNELKKQSKPKGFGKQVLELTNKLSELEKENDRLKSSFEALGKRLLHLEEVKTELQHQLQDEEATNQALSHTLTEGSIDFSNPQEAGKRLFEQLKKQTINNHILLITQLHANSYRYLRELTAKRKNDYDFAQKKLHLLMDMSEDIGKNEIAFE